ncbi:MAG: CofH family radical SAM protein [Rikenellaceae bacterium]
MDFKDALEIYRHASLEELMGEADLVRRRIKEDSRVVTYQIDRNVNITNVCRSGCRFCSFHTRLADKQGGYITTMDEYKEKIEGLRAVGGRQLLLQGGMHPHLGIEYYEELFRSLKGYFPELILHALGAPEVFYLAGKAFISIEEALRRLVDAGLDSLPGAGAELLNNEWRKKNTPLKCSGDEWLSVMETAQTMGLLTSATMMYGFRDSDELRIEHLYKIRELQSLTGGFRAFISWPYRGKDIGKPSAEEYLRVVAISRLVLDNIENIQASWLTVGVESGVKALSGGANDMGSIMIEENVVRSAGVSFSMNESRMRTIIEEAGYIPRLRDQAYNLL